MNATKFRFEQLAGGNTHKLYIYDDVTAYGPFNWETWDYDESETSAKYFREQLESIPDSGPLSCTSTATADLSRKELPFITS